MNRSESSRCERYNSRVEPTAYGGGSRANPLDGQTSMRSISVQIQPERSPNFNLSAVTRAFSEIATDGTLVRHHAFDHGRESTAYYNFTFGTERAADLWRVIRRRLFEDPTLGDEMRRVSIATCSSETE